MRFSNLFYGLGLFTTVFLSIGLPVFSEEAMPATPESCITKLQSLVDETDQKKKVDPTSLRSKRIELYYYRNANKMVELLNKLPYAEPGCASELTANSVSLGTQVGQGGGNVVFLYGTELYIENIQRLITTLDLPLPGINLQLWGIQVSSKNPRRLAEAMVKVRSEISDTQQLLRELFGRLQGEIVKELSNSDNFDPRYRKLVNELGYGKVFESSRNISLLDISVVGNSVKNPADFYLNLANSLQDLETNDPRYSKYFEDMRSRPNSPPPFERFFRSRGLKPECMSGKSSKTKHGTRCEKWEWKKNKLWTNQLAKTKQKATLNFALQYADFVSNPEKFDADELLLTADVVNTGLQNFSDSFQKDIEDFFIRPTLLRIQDKVRHTKGVTFAQVGRTTISALSGVATEINSKSTSVFKVSPPDKTFDQLLDRASTIQGSITKVVGPIEEAADAASAGPIPVSNLIGLVAALSEQQTVPIEAETGTNLKFTPGILRNSNSAELSIDLTLTDPTFKGTSDTDPTKKTSISRVGAQTIKTSVYTQAMDFFDLSTFTNQATLDGGRFRIPIIGQLWNSIFGGIPVFGDLFSLRRGNQNIYHESLILTNSFITPTPLGIGLLFPPKKRESYTGFSTSIDQLFSNTPKYCIQQGRLLDYLKSTEQISVTETTDQRRCQ